MSDGIRINRAGPASEVLEITLDRPAKRNALRARDCHAVTEALRRGGLSASCVLIRGAGPHFCAGADTDEVLSERPDTRAAVVAAWTDMLLEVLRIPVPVVTAVTGACVGGGQHLNLAADVSIARSDSFYKHSGTDVSLVPMELGTMLLSLTVGLRRAKLQVLGERQYDAAEAHSVGLCSEVAAPERFESAVKARVVQLCAVSRLAMASAKAILNQSAIAATAPASLSTLLGLTQLAIEDERKEIVARMQAIKGRGR